MSSRQLAAPEERFAAVVAAFVGAPGVTPPEEAVEKRRMFGANGLRIHGHLFAMLTHGRFVVKLPRQRVEALVAAGQGEHFDPGHGRLMKEWLALDPASDLEWPPLAEEALAYVRANG